ncbi:hypothetical protein [Streptomyces cirratus]
MDNSSLETVVRRTLWCSEGRAATAATARLYRSPAGNDYFSSW